MLALRILAAAMILAQCAHISSSSYGIMACFVPEGCPAGAGVKVQKQSKPEALARRASLHALVQDICCWVQETYGVGQGLKWWVYWRLFYLACSELFRYHKGNEWGVGHYLFCQAAQSSANAATSPVQENGH